MNNEKCEISVEEQIPTCPACGAPCVREIRELKAAKITVKIWVCPDQKTKSCI